MQGPVFYKNEWVAKTHAWSAKHLHTYNLFWMHPQSGEMNNKWVSNGRKQFLQAKEFSMPNCLYRIEVHSICMDTIAFERTENQVKRTRNEWVTVGTVSAGKKIRWCRIFLLAETISYRHSLIYCSFRLIFGAFKSDCMYVDTVHFKCEIWSLIHFYRKLGPNMHFLPAAWDWGAEGV